MHLRVGDEPGDGGGADDGNGGEGEEHTFPELMLKGDAQSGRVLRGSGLSFFPEEFHGIRAASFPSDCIPARGENFSTYYYI